MEKKLINISIKEKLSASNQQTGKFLQSSIKKIRKCKGDCFGLPDFDNDSALSDYKAKSQVKLKYKNLSTTDSLEMNKQNNYSDEVKVNF